MNLIGVDLACEYREACDLETSSSRMTYPSRVEPLVVRLLKTPFQEQVVAGKETYISLQLSLERTLKESENPSKATILCNITRLYSITIKKDYAITYALKQSGLVKELLIKNEIVFWGVMSQQIASFDPVPSRKIPKGVFTDFLFQVPPVESLPKRVQHPVGDHSLFEGKAIEKRPPRLSFRPRSSDQETSSHSPRSSRLPASLQNQVQREHHRTTSQGPSVRLKSKKQEANGSQPFSAHTSPRSPTSPSMLGLERKLENPLKLRWVKK